MSQVETSELIRIAYGHVSKSTILGSSTYKIENFPIQSDNVAYPYWQAYMDGGIREGIIEQSLSGAGGLYGDLSGTLTLVKFTPDMQQYWFETVMNNQYIAPVTLYVFHPRRKAITINCYLTFDVSPNNATQQTDTKWTNVTLPWNRGAVVGGAFSSGFSEGFS